jgi:hypothetical protein
MRGDRRAATIRRRDDRYLWDPVANPTPEQWQASSATAQVA